MTITTTYTITLDGRQRTYTDTYENVFNKRDAHLIILSHWHGVEKVVFNRDIIEF